MRLIHLTTVPQTLLFLRGQAGFFRSQGFDVHAVSSGGEELRWFAATEGVTAHAVPMRRAISPLADLVALLRLWRLFRSLRPDIVHAHTPKAGLLGMIAATLAGVPMRIYHIHGLPVVTSRGLRRALLTMSDRLSCRLAHRVLCVSRSIRELATCERLVAGRRIEVLGAGSINGVDAEHRFRRSAEVLTAAQQVRMRWGIPQDAIVVGFVGRVVREKGVGELAEAWLALRQEFPSAHLLIVGTEETHDPVDPATLQKLRADPNAHFVGQDWETPPLYAAMNVLALPTYREGFVVVALEAAAMELPIVGSDVPGCRDAVVDGETGCLVPARDPHALRLALARYMRDPDLRRKHGLQGRARTLRDYRPQTLWTAQLDVYRDLTPNRRAAGVSRPRSV